MMIFFYLFVYGKHFVYLLFVCALLAFYMMFYVDPNSTYTRKRRIFFFGNTVFLAFFVAKLVTFVEIVGLNFNREERLSVRVKVINAIVQGLVIAICVNLLRWILVRAYFQVEPDSSPYFPYFCWVDLLLLGMFLVCLIGSILVIPLIYRRNMVEQIVQDIIFQLSLSVFATNFMMTIIMFCIGLVPPGFWTRYIRSS